MALLVRICLELLLACTSILGQPCGDYLVLGPWKPRTLKKVHTAMSAMLDKSYGCQFYAGVDIRWMSILRGCGYLIQLVRTWVLVFICGSDLHLPRESMGADVDFIFHP
jgi:hypothetical protein